ncbi:ATP-dependent DNA helicase RecG [bacterium]|nr:ATP-dependent DNA helicase RecG [bacterium]
MPEKPLYSPEGIDLVNKLLKVLRREYLDGCRGGTLIVPALRSFRERAGRLPNHDEALRLCSQVKNLDNYSSLGLAQRKYELIQTGQRLRETAESAVPANNAETAEVRERADDGSEADGGAREACVDTAGTETESFAGLKAGRAVFSLDAPIENLAGVGVKKAQAFRNLGISTFENLLFYCPRRWEDRKTLTPIAELKPGTFALIEAEILSVEHKRLPGNKTLLEATVFDSSGSVRLSWFNQAYIANSLHEEMQIYAYGKAEYDKGALLRISSPDFTKKHTFSPSLNRIVPIYPLAAGLSQSFFHRIMYRFVPAYAGKLQESLPEELLKKYGFPERRSALLSLHWPQSLQALRLAQKRFAFEELFAMQLVTAGKKLRQHQEERSVIYKNLGALKREFQELLPFSLTKAQQRVIDEITEALLQNYPMNRLLQGDVGSGKTVIAAFLLFAAVKSGFQAALMAPTEILAEQHFKKLSELFASLNFRIARLQGSLSRKQKLQAAELLAEGGIDIVIGTHALIQQNVSFKNLGAAVIDEQHKFGVMQRQTLKDKSGAELRCDTLLMTATPIPRTMALTVYGNLDLSVLNELPPGRQPIKSQSLPADQSRRAYDCALEQIKSGRQAYIICPLINESDRKEAAAAIQEAESLRNGFFKSCRVGLLHGKLKAAEKEEIMQAFRRGEYDVLISTTVIEVGVDVPNASVMIIRDANLFGLAQLHQLRGRIGRGRYESFCFFIASKDMQSTRKLTAIAKLSDGMDVAEEDLDIRGPGDYFGSRQSGFPELQFADLIRDADLLETARREAPNYLNAELSLNFSPSLA